MAGRDQFMEGVPPGFERWQAYARALWGAGLDGAQQLRAIEAAGANAAELSSFLREYFRWCPGSWSGRVPRSPVDPDCPELALQAFSMLQEPWAVVEHLGTGLVELQRAYLARTPPQAWTLDADRMRLPGLLRDAISAEGFRFEGEWEELDLRVLPQRFDGSLDVSGPIRRLRLPPRLNLTGSLTLRHCGGLRGLRHLLGINKNLVLEHCPDLKVLYVPSGARLEVSDCPCLEHI